ncbi:MOSC N-terminal beta barrel domain-containing protein [Trametes meyenii]|nr:MOSC N-terminal beta barrel domain-containing protein [Trametes meyenii]
MAVSYSLHELWHGRLGSTDTSLAWTASVLVLSLAGLLWSLARRSSGRASPLQPTKTVGTNGSSAAACPPEQLKDDLKGGVVNSYALERELTVPFELGDVRVAKILMHPIKSCRGTSLQEARYTPEGLENDRKWCIVEAETHTIITAREVAKMVLITPRVEADATSPHGGKLVISFPEDSDCETFSVPLYPTEELLADWPIIEDCTMFGKYLVEGYVVSSGLGGPGARTPSEILSDYFGRAVHLAMKGLRARECPPTDAFPELRETAMFQDGYPFLVASQESLGEVRRVVSAYAQDESAQEHIGGIDRKRWRDGGVEIERFRPNIVFKGSGVPFAEDMWRRIRIHPAGGLDEQDAVSDKETRTFTLVSKCTRCLLPNVDTTTGTRDAAVPYKVLLKFRRNKDPARKHKPCFGCNAIVGGEGVVRVGDRVEVLEWAGGVGV